MEKEYFISIVLDKRRAKSNGKFPVKLRVFTPNPRIQMLYPTIFDYTEKEFESIWESKKTKAEYKDRRIELQGIENEAYKTAKELKPFSFELFERKHFRKTGDGQNVLYHYQRMIDKLKSNDQLGTASNYELSKKSLLLFVEHLKGKTLAKILFSEIDSSWLNKYEKYMTVEKERSLTTVSMYLRALRTIFNNAISEKEINAELYPFGKKKYQVPAVRNVKKALNKDHLKQLFEAIPQTPEQEKAKDFWFFSYACNGINMKDIAQLRWENIHDDMVVLYRAKTINTNKADLKPITLYLNAYSKSILDKYGSSPKTARCLIFPIISDDNDAETNFRLLKNFIVAVNKNLKKLCKNEGLPKEISTYWARHTFATTAIRNGASMEFVGEALNHNNLKTTQAYFAGFEDNVKKEFMEGLMKF